MSQLDANGNGGMMTSRLNGKKVTSKHCPLGFAEMPADFINAYILGSLGTTGTSMGACASFLYNLRQGLLDIQTGKSRVVIVGNSEAPITPEIMDGYAAMGALATDNELLELDKALGLEVPNYRRACRPFSDNCGFTIAESAQFVVLFDDELAMEMGATIHGAVSDVFVSADGFKKSISSPGVGNYITFAKAVAAAKSIVGEESIRHRSFVQAHGTGTPQNRVTESHILNETAKAFGIQNWPVAAIKSYLGHSIGVAAGDQVVSSLGVWKHGIIPGVHSIDHLADDVFASNLAIDAKHMDIGRSGSDVAIINAKGFGGNNATASLLAPHIVERMLEKKYGQSQMSDYRLRNEAVLERSQQYDTAMTEGSEKPIYKFDNGVLAGEDIHFDEHSMKIPGYEHAIDLNIQSPYKDAL
jgi:acetoacetyl-[acyl-carrier protein] synthase